MPRPSPAGLAVAALVGAIAAGSWTFSTWLTLARAPAPAEAVIQVAGQAMASVPLPAAEDSHE